MRLAWLLLIVLAPPAKAQDQANTVLIHLRDNGVIGTGTIVDADGGRALVLTCEHLFYDPLNPIGAIGASRMGDPIVYRATFLGRSHEPGADLAALVIPDPGNVRRLELAPEQPRQVSYAGFGLDRTICWVRRGRLVDSICPDTFVAYAGLGVVPGDSGSGLFDERGRFAGVVSFYQPENGAGETNPLTMIKRFLKSPQVAKWRSK